MAVEFIAEIAPKGTFALLNAQHIAFKDGRLPDYIPVPMTQADYDAAKAAGTLNKDTLYLIVEEDDAT